MEKNTLFFFFDGGFSTCFNRKMVRIRKYVSPISVNFSYSPFSLLLVYWRVQEWTFHRKPIHIFLKTWYVYVIGGTDSAYHVRCLVFGEGAKWNFQDGYEINQHLEPLKPQKLSNLDSFQFNLVARVHTGHQFLNFLAIFDQGNLIRFVILFQTPPT